MKTPGRLADKDGLDQVIAELREIDRRTGIERTLAVGELILTRFFDGNPGAWRDRRRNKGNSIRRLAEREDCPFGKSALNDAVGIYVVVTESPCVRTFGHITASHVAAVLTLSVPERERLLGLADRERMSVRTLRAKVIETRRVSGERRGRPRSSREQRVLSMLTSAEKRFSTAIKELETLSRLGWTTCQHLRELASRFSALEARLSALGSSLSDGLATDVVRFARAGV
jgi:hypothetical protein